MKKIAENDLCQLYTTDADGQWCEWCAHERMFMDNRAKLVIDLVRIWGGAHLVSDAMSGLADRPHHKHKTIEELVFIAADTVDAIYAETERRGWRFPVPNPDDDTYL